MLYIPALSHIPNDRLGVGDAPESYQLRSSRNSFAFSNLLYVEEEIRSQHRDYYTYFFNRRYACRPSAANRRQRIADTVLYLLHPNQKNYSHYTLQVLSGFLAAKSFGMISQDIKISIDDSLKWQNELIDIYDIDRNQILRLEPDIIYDFDRVIYYDSLMTGVLDLLSYQLYSMPMQTLAPHLQSEPLKLYITRKESGRKATNEADVIEFMKSHGFHIADFAEIPVMEQISLVNRASTIVAQHGASGANLVYKDNRRFKFVELFSNAWRSTCHVRILRTKNCDYTPFISPAHGQSSCASVTIDIGRLEQALDTVSHSFDYFSPDNRGQNEYFSTKITALIKQKRDAAQIATLYADGDYLNIYQNYRAKQIDNFDNDTLFYIYISTLFHGTLDEFKMLTFYLANRHPDSMGRHLLFACQKINDTSFYNTIKNLVGCTPNMQERLITEDMPHYPGYYGILSWHNLIFSYNEKSMRLEQSKKFDCSVLASFDGPKTYLFIPSVGKYVKEIHDDGSVILSSEYTTYKISRFNGHCISIPSSTGFLSAGRRGTITKAAWSRTWEKYFLID